MALQNGAQLIFQCERSDGTFECLGFAGIPVVNPILLVLCSANTSQARKDLATLRAAFLTRLQTLSPNLKSVSLPCPHIVGSPDSCHAIKEPDCQKILVVVGDDSQPVSMQPYYNAWLSGDSTYRLLPVFRKAARTSVSALLPSVFHHINVEFWTTSIAQAIPAILSLSNLTPASPRIFISYRQKDSAALAMQLFDALSHAGFEAFLDHFRIPPGVNFQARLTQELGDKSMVLLIESEHILDSEWTTYEINIAKTCSLGVFALNAPNGVFVPGIDPAIRMTVSNADFQGGSFSPTSELIQDVLASVVDRAKAEHDQALVRRKQILHDSLEGALAAEGVALAPLTPRGMVPVRSNNGIEYLIWLTPRPPELLDFHSVHGATIPPAKGVVIGLSRLMEPTRFEQTAWLAGLSQIIMIEEGQLKKAASAIAKGTL
jgi:hypothetical protein